MSLFYVSQQLLISLQMEKQVKILMKEKCPDALLEPFRGRKLTIKYPSTAVRPAGCPPTETLDTTL